MTGLTLIPEWWHWAIIGLGLAILEIFVPAGFLIGLGIAAFLVAFLVYFISGISWGIQLFMFAILSFISVFTMRRWLRSKPIKSDQPLLNQRGHQYVGRKFKMNTSITNGQGKIRVDDSTWKVYGPDCEVGTTIVITGVNGVVLDVMIARESDG